MDYTLHQLRVFLKICKNQSVTKASEELFLTQPAVSLQLKKLQDQFPVPLTEVIGRKLHITEFGRDIEKAALKIVEEIEAIEYTAKLHKGILAGKLRISIVSTGKYVMPYFLSEFMEKFDAIDLTMDVTNKRQVIQDLENNNVDFSLVSVIPEKLNLSRIALLPNQLYLVGKSNPIDKKISAKKILSSRPLIFREQGSATRDFMEGFIKSNEISMYKNIELTSNEAVKQAVMAGIGYSIMPLIGIKNEIKNGDLEIIPCKGLPMVSEWNLVWLKEKKLSPPAQALMSFIAENKERIVNDNFLWYMNYV